jgi:hypothetical protein
MDPDAPPVGVSDGLWDVHLAEALALVPDVEVRGPFHVQSLGPEPAGDVGV